MGGQHCFPGYKMHPKYLELVNEPKFRLALAVCWNSTDTKGTTNIVNVKIQMSAN